MQPTQEPSNDGSFMPSKEPNNTPNIQPPEPATTPPPVTTDTPSPTTTTPAPVVDTSNLSPNHFMSPQNVTGPVVGSFEPDPTTPAPLSQLPGAPGPGNPMPPPKSNKGLFKKAIIGVIVLVILAGGAAAAYEGYYVPNQPKNVLGQALINMVSGNKLTSASFNATGSYTDSSSKQTYSATLSGAADQTGKVDATLSVDALITTLTLEVRSVDGKNVYVKVGGLDGLTQLLGSTGLTSSDPGIASLLQSVNNQWYEINQSLITSIEKDENITPGKPLTQADINKLSSLYKQNQFVTVDKVLPSQSIGGVSSYHYQVMINKSKLTSFVNGLKTDNITDLGISSTYYTDIDNALSGVNTSKYPFDIWITKGSKLIDQVSLSTTDNGNPITAKLTLTNINKPVTVTAPASSQSILQLIAEVTQDLGLSSTGSGSSGGGTGINPLDLLGGGASDTQSL